jgi:ABC-type multidrug transport system ATPase subunit
VEKHRGIPGEDLNVEQRKRLTFGVKLVVRPARQLLLDEHTSGLGSQTSSSIVTFLAQLSKSRQAVLCTIHQPSAILFQRFNRLLLLAKGECGYHVVVPQRYQYSDIPYRRTTTLSIKDVLHRPLTPVRSSRC